MRAIMFGETDAPPDPATQSTLASEVAKSDLLGVLIASLPSLHFETRKDAAAVFNGLMRVEPEDGSGGFCAPVALVPIRPRSRGERRSLRTFAGAALRPTSPLGFNPGFNAATPFIDSI
jgi:hypothetical protein